MAKVVWTAEAEHWLRRIHDYIAADKPGSSSRARIFAQRRALNGRAAAGTAVVL